ncbi:inosine-5'-monophosphate dehydrogenase [mine drainage metagenome]|uniref:Inosine-5'-monophosphate dehydrogenase n=1 Tax=mine drainage metagenome TaxID=410659 RepID=A0A1J5RFV6_9ZZZZ
MFFNQRIDDATAASCEIPVVARPDPQTEVARIGVESGGLGRRTLFISLLAIAIGVAAACIAQALLALIGLITHLSFQGTMGWTLADPALRAWLDTEHPDSRHQGYPVVDAHGSVQGVLTGKDLFAHDADPAGEIGRLVRRPAVTIHADATLAEAMQKMAVWAIGRLPVLDDAQGGGELVGMLTRSDLLKAYREHLLDKLEHGR